MRILVYFIAIFFCCLVQQQPLFAQNCNCENPSFNMIVNGDFEDSATLTTPPNYVGFESDYSPLFPTGIYGIIKWLTSPANIGNQWCAIPGTNNMLFVDGTTGGGLPSDAAVAPYDILRYPNMTVIPGQEYKISFSCMESVNTGTTGLVIDVKLNGVIYTSFPMLTDCSQWTKYETCWVADTTSVTFALNAGTGSAGGRDFVMDSIYFGSCGPLILDGDSSTLDTVFCYDNIDHKILGLAPGGTFTGGGIVQIGSDWFFNPALAVGSSTIYPHVCPITYTDTNNIGISATMYVYPTPIVSIGADTIMCQVDTIQFHPIVGPSYTYTYLWSPSAYLSDDTIIDPICIPQTDITYVLTVTNIDSFCSSRDTINVTVVPADVLFVNPDTTVCKGDAVQILAIADTLFNIRWIPTSGISDTNLINPLITPDTTTNYIVIATYPGCPDITKDIQIAVEPVPQVTVSSDTSTCQWYYLGLYGDVQPDYYQYYTYEWTPAVNLDYTNILTPVLTAQNNTTYTLTVTTPAGCRGTDNVNVTVWPGNFATINADTAVCPHSEVLLSATGGVAYKWTPSYCLDTATKAAPIALPITTTEFVALVTDINGCFDTVSTNVTVYPQAVLSLADSATIYPGESYQIDPNGNCLYYQWFPPAGLNSATIGNPVATPIVDTRYFLQAATENGCLATDSIDIFVSNETAIDIPNAFAPGSGPNGSIKVVKRGIAKLKYFQIYNRWGNKVFETTNIDEGWDGRFNGVPQPMGVYVFQVAAETNTGRIFQKQGNITLLR